jgi:hypothetical protein
MLWTLLIIGGALASIDIIGTGSTGATDGNEDTAT